MSNLFVRLLKVVSANSELLCVRCELTITVIRYQPWSLGSGSTVCCFRQTTAADAMITLFNHITRRPSALCLCSSLDSCAFVGVSGAAAACDVAVGRLSSSDDFTYVSYRALVMKRKNSVMDLKHPRDLLRSAMDEFCGVHSTHMRHFLKRNRETGRGGR
jgi:hypothetical protein